GESEITWGEPLYLSGVVTRNSPLWVSNPKQQIAYLGVKYWARLYCPEVILGVYSPDEVEQREEREINPAPVQRMSVQEITSEVSTTTSAQESATNVDAVADDLRERIDTASSVDQAKAIRADIESQKALLGTALFTELKNKAVKRYYQVDAQNKVEAVINSIPNSGEPEAAEMFTKAESTLGAAKRHLGDELYDKYRITLDDMKPEYIG
ncbi:recombinase RecT, partial [Salmonella enterica]|nr:recombinase RecT [Salmonella enterica]